MLQSVVGTDKDIQICSEAFSWISWSTSLDVVNESLSKKVTISTTAMPTEFYSSALVEDLLSPFCMFDKDGHEPGSSPEINQYMSIAWTEQKRSIPSFISVYAAAASCRTTLDSLHEEIVPLSVLTAFNRGDDLESED